MSALFDDVDFSHDVKTKRCSTCKKQVPVTQYSKASGGNYLYHQCRTCVRVQGQIRKKLKIDHPLTDELTHRCPICNRTAQEAFGKGGQKIKTSWVLDHDHITGKFRGYICHSCNRGLGIFGDSIQSLIKAIEYLKNG